MTEEKSLNFIEEIIEADLKAGKYKTIVTRFPPEPNGYLHMGHATSICLNFGLSKKYGGYTNLRFDDTNPVTEETEYVESIKDDVRWLGFEWKNELYASDYFDTLYGFAVKLINKGLAYVDDSSADAMAKEKGTPTEPGVENKFRNRSIEENLQLFEEMKAGKFMDGERVLRAKIDMAHVNMLMRDPVMYRIKHAHHHRTGDKWCIYPLYDFAHGQSDSIEEVTHSICTLEFVPHRELYDWFIEKLEIFPSKQYEFARRNLSYTVMSKRKLLQLVNEKHVNGWDDPRMPTISAFRRRGYTPESIRDFCDRVGIAKRDNVADLSLLEFCVREDLNKEALRRMVVFEPLKVVITNYNNTNSTNENTNLPTGMQGYTNEDTNYTNYTNYTNGHELLEIDDNPTDDKNDARKVPFSKELYIEQEDFMENPPKKFFRLFPGGMVRLKGAYIIKCDEVIKDAAGNITELHCSYIPESHSGHDSSGIKVKGTIHWVSIPHAETAELRLYDRLFKVEDPQSEEGDFKDYINPDSLEIITAYMEPSLKDAQLNTPYQFIRKGYFVLDKDSTPRNLIFNRTVTLKEAPSKSPPKGETC
ncbi:MAG: glutamine--tRNA ligase/YqeY domain fusion protein [Bacteroidota bacterium]|nr:glutamine--tRNA ligase/YqeY domain fusion protein [Bacteroidota bacterium]